MLKWMDLDSREAVDSLAALSRDIPCIILKHSSSCNLSAIARYRLETDWDFEPTAMQAFLVSVQEQRDVSRYISEKFQVFHESPQLLLIRDGECTYEASQLEINVDDLRECYQEKPW